MTKILVSCAFVIGAYSPSVWAGLTCSSGGHGGGTGGCESTTEEECECICLDDAIESLFVAYDRRNDPEIAALIVDLESEYETRCSE